MIQAVFIGLFTGLLIRATDCLLASTFEKPTAADHSDGRRRPRRPVIEFNLGFFKTE